MANTIDQQVNKYLQSIGVAVSTVGRGETKRNDWICDAWSVCFARNSKAETFDYFTGTGHRKVIRGLNATKYPNAKFTKGYWQVSIAQKPEPAGVINSILLDSSDCDESFNDWCSNFEYDTDSRKALETYLECQNNYNRFRKIFTQSEIEVLREMLQDY